jgi:hypothetical protein
VIAKETTRKTHLLGDQGVHGSASRSRARIAAIRPSVRTQGWYRDEETGEEFFDEHIRFEIDAQFNDADKEFLRLWKQTLGRRFRQRSIYMKLMGPVVWA